MEKEKFMPYLELCRHYFETADKFAKSEPDNNDLALTVYQQDFVHVVECLKKYSSALYQSLIASCVDSLYSDLPHLKYEYDFSKFGINPISK